MGKEEYHAPVVKNCEMDTEGVVVSFDSGIIAPPFNEDEW